MMCFQDAAELYYQECARLGREPRRPNGTLSVKTGDVWRLNSPAGGVAEVSESTRTVTLLEPEQARSTP